MTKHIKRLRNTPFDDVFRTLLEKCSKLIIPVINEIFHTDYSFRDEVQVLANEQYFMDEEGNEVKKVTDAYLKIGDGIYHVECQSTDDTYMEIRMMEYDIHIAMDNVTINNGIRVVELPQSAVLVVKSDSKYPKFLKTVLRIPQYNPHITEYREIEYTVPTCKIDKYGKEEIIKKNLIFLTPYYIIKFKKRLDEIDKDGEKLKDLVRDYQEIYGKITELADKEELGDSYLYDVISLTEKLIDVVAKGRENIRREVSVMGGNVLKLDREILIEESEARGEEIGKEIGEERFRKLMCILYECGNADEIQRVLSDKEYSKELYKKYKID